MGSREARQPFNERERLLSWNNEKHLIAAWHRRDSEQGFAGSGI